METQPVQRGGSGNTAPKPEELAERRKEAHSCLKSISQHSFWFDVWVFLLFDLVLFIFVYLLP